MLIDTGFAQSESRKVVTLVVIQGKLDRIANKRSLCIWLPVWSIQKVTFFHRLLLGDAVLEGIYRARQAESRGGDAARKQTCVLRMFTSQRVGASPPQRYGRR